MAKLRRPSADDLVSGAVRRQEVVERLQRIGSCRGLARRIDQGAPFLTMVDGREYLVAENDELLEVYQGRTDRHFADSDALVPAAIDWRGERHLVGFC